MGSGASTINYTNVSNMYHFTGNNNGMRSGDTSFGSASASASTDVSPKTDLNYSMGVNPSWTGILSGFSRGTKQLLGSVGNNSDLIQTFKHVGATALRVGMGDGTFKQKATKLISELLTNSTPDGSLQSTEQVSLQSVKDVAELQAECVNRLPAVHDAFQTVALGSTGMRNMEVSTCPTPESISGLKKRASSRELQAEREIMTTVGPKFGIMPSNTDVPPSDITISTFENARTNYGRMGHVKTKTEEISRVQSNIFFSILHNSASDLAKAGMLRPFTIESSQFIGLVNQVSIPFTADAYPNGHSFKSADLITTTTEVRMRSDESLLVKQFALSSYAYALPFPDSSRDVRLMLSGQIVIANQVYQPDDTVQLGILYSKDGQRYIMPAVYINKDVVRRDVEVSGGKYKGHHVSAIGLDHGSSYVKTLTESPKLTDKVVNSTTSTRFSYSSQWQVVINLSDCDMLTINELVGSGVQEWKTDGRKVQAVLVAKYPSAMILSIAVQTPVLSITVIRPPQELRYIGNKYYNSVLSLLGHVPAWYATQDMHDPWRIYYEVVKPLIKYAGRIAVLHVASGAPYALTVDHVTRARANSGLSILDVDEMKVHIHLLIVGIAKWMSDAGPVHEYIHKDRVRLFMHICEKVMFQSLSHISVFADEVNVLVPQYLRDCNEQNAYEERMDRQLKVV